jgi:hypothetical protein
MVKQGFVIAKDPGNVTADISAILALLPVVTPVVSKAQDIPKEFLDLSEEESAALVSHVMSSLAVEKQKAREIVKYSLKFAFNGYHLGMAIAK